MLHRFGAFEFDEQVFELRRAGASVPIEPRALELLAYFLHNRGRLIRHDELIREVWKGTAVSRSAIAFAVSSLRAALGAEGAEAFVTTVHGRGYRFAAAEAPAPAPEPGAADPPPPAERALAPPFVGRHGELGALAQALERARCGRRCISLVTGEAGIGKTRLAEEHAERSRARGFAVYVGRCLEDDAAPDYWPWLQLLRAALEREAPTPHGALLRRFADGADDWHRALGLCDGGALGAARFRLFDAISRFWMDAARRQPLLLVLEDVHGADRASLRLLEFFARSSRDARIALLASYRAPHPSPALLELTGALGRDPETRVFELGPLAPAEVAELVESALGDAPRPDLAEAVYRRTEGHPLFVSEMCRGIERERERLHGAAPGAIALAGGVRDAIGARVARVSASCRRRLQAASALGREVDPRLLLQVDDATPAEHLAALDEAIAARLLEADAGLAKLRFCHALVREVVYDVIPLQRRAELHLRAADALAAAAPEHGAELARHLLLAGPLADPLRVVEACAAEGRRAASLLAFEAALAHFDQAIEVLAQRAPGELARRCDLLLEQTELAARSGDAARARAGLAAAAALARRLRSPERLARAVLADPGASARSAPTVVPENDVAMLEEALRELPATPTPMRVELLSRLSNLLHWSDDQQRRCEAAAQALEMARALGEPRALGRALLARHLVLWTPDHLRERLAVADECLQLARSAGDRELQAFAHQARATVFFEQADAERHRCEVDAMRRMLAGAPEPLFGHYRSWLAVVDGTRAFLGGRFDEAERLAREAARLDSEARRWTGLLMFSIRREQGRLAELDALLPLIAAQDAPLHAWRASLVLLHADAGRAEQAREGCALLRDGSWRRRRDATWLPTLAMLAQVTALGRERSRAEALLAELEPYADRILVLAQGVGSFGSVARHLGLLNAALGRHVEAVRHFERALEIAERWDAELWLAVGRCELASALYAQGKRARALYAEGVAAARRIGLAPLAWLAEHASDAPRRRWPPDGPSAVTLIKS